MALPVDMNNRVSQVHPALGGDESDRTYTWLRAPLFVPGDSERKIAKAAVAGTDCLILDLEDSVAPSAKDAARALVRASLDRPRSSRLCVRINAWGSPWYLDDLAVISEGRPDAIMLPKCCGAADIVRLDDQLSVLEAAYELEVGSIGIVPLVTETAAALRNLDYRGVSGRLRALAFAAEDLSADLGIAARDGGGAMNPLVMHARLAVAIAASEAGLLAIDTPFSDPANEAGLLREAQEAAALGYAGKLCIHPNQIPTLKSAFTPDEDQIRWAHAVVAAFGAAPGAGVALLEGKMIDKAHLRLAERRLRLIDPEREVA